MIKRKKKKRPIKDESLEQISNVNTSVMSNPLIKLNALHRHHSRISTTSGFIMINSNTFSK
jgi:hypothetical protein